MEVHHRRQRSAFLNPLSMTESIRTFCRNSNQSVPETLAELARCVFDSLALSYKQVKAQLELLSGHRLKRIRIVGGGCRNQLLNQLCADACGVPVIAGPMEAAALGNLSAQMIALGEIDNLDAARALIRASFDMQEYRPGKRVPARVSRQFEELLSARIKRRGARMTPDKIKEAYATCTRAFCRIRHQH